MFALMIEYLTGRCVATDHTNREEAEWPPHPFRVFCALVATMKDIGETKDYRAGLEWLEKLKSPAIHASQVDRRITFNCYVPPNDSKGIEVLPEKRKRQLRTFPSVTPHNPVVHLVWPEASPSNADRRALEGLCSIVSRLGHSSSLVSVRVVDSWPVPNHIPDDAGQTILRVPFAGNLTALETSYETHRGFLQRTLPAGYSRYRISDSEKSETTIPQSVFSDDLVVFKQVAGPRLPIKSTIGLTSIFRRAAIKFCEEPVPETLSGHTTEGGHSTRPHVAFVALPNVGHTFADGSILGLAGVLPRGLDPLERRRILRALGQDCIKKINLGSAGIWHIERQTVESSLHGLQPWTWCRPARNWATVTPIILDRYPKKNAKSTEEEIIAEACRRVGLPEPKLIQTCSDTPVLGAPPVWTFPAQKSREGKPRRWHTHAKIVFEKPVRGPIILGAGRYLGYGLCRPVDSPGRAS